jgi:hypothetical protein
MYVLVDCSIFGCGGWFCRRTVFAIIFFDGSVFYIYNGPLSMVHGTIWYHPASPSISAYYPSCKSREGKDSSSALATDRKGGHGLLFLKEMLFVAYKIVDHKETVKHVSVRRTILIITSHSVAKIILFHVGGRAV